jgi:hypothetical protein
MLISEEAIAAVGKKIKIKKCAESWNGERKKVVKNKHYSI